MTRIFGLIALLILLVVPVNAFNLSEIPYEITVSDEPVRFSILIENTSGFEKNLDLDYSFPSMVQEQYVPRKIAGSSNDKIILLIMPSDELTNSTYNAWIKVKLGNEVIEKNVSIKYVKAVEEKIIEEETNNDFTAGLIGLISLPELNLTDLVIDLILLIVVAVLMISFISRMVSYLNKKPEQKEKMQEKKHALIQESSRLTELRKNVLGEKNE
ncbi:MAG: hypothetical protein JW703_03735 [Candidatus Diapherotrites archaeon]|nr:hypothetical protein [Candidatus Diapherotrites archaeon]